MLAHLSIPVYSCAHRIGSKSQAELPSTLQLQTSSALGTGKPLTNQDRLEKAEDKVVRRAMGHTQPAGKHRKRNGGFTGVASDNDDDDSEEELALNGASTSCMIVDDAVDLKEGSSKERPVVIFDSALPVPAEGQVAPSNAIVGSALQKNADGSVVAPRIMKKKAKGKSVCGLCFVIAITRPKSTRSFLADNPPEVEASASSSTYHRGRRAI